MIKQELNTTFNRSIAEIWDWLTNPENTLKYEASAMQLTKTPQPPLRVGSKWEGNMDLEGQSLHTVCEVTGLEPKKVMAYKFTNKAFDVVGGYRFEPVDTSATKVTPSFQAEMLGPWKEMEPMFAEEFKREDEAEFMAFTKEIEAST